MERNLVPLFLSSLQGPVTNRTATRVMQYTLVWVQNGIFAGGQNYSKSKYQNQYFFFLEVINYIDFNNHCMIMYQHLQEQALRGKPMKIMKTVVSTKMPQSFLQCILKWQLTTSKKRGQQWIAFSFGWHYIPPIPFFISSILQFFSQEGLLLILILPGGILTETHFMSLV